MQLNEKLLNIIDVVQSYKWYRIREIKILDLNRDWYKETEDYYYNLPRKLLDEVGLRKNNFDFERVIRFKITDEISSTEYKDLGRFDF